MEKSETRGARRALRPGVAAKDFGVGGAVAAAARSDDLVRGRIGNAAARKFEERGFAQAGIFEAAEGKARQRGRAGGDVIRSGENDGVGKAGEAHHLIFTGAEAELVEAREFEDRRFLERCSDEARDRVTGGEGLAALMIRLNDRDAAIVRESGAAHFCNFSDFRGGDIQRFELFDRVVFHASGVERLGIERLDVFAACGEKRERGHERKERAEAEGDFINSGFGKPDNLRG